MEWVFYVVFGERDCGVSVAKKSNPALERGGKRK
jgi:hypothetical protein